MQQIEWSVPGTSFFAFEGKFRRSVVERQSMEALQQLYGYMRFNDNKYGALINWDRAWFCQRVETADYRGKMLQCRLASMLQSKQRLLESGA